MTDDLTDEELAVVDAEEALVFDVLDDLATRTSARRIVLALCKIAADHGYRGLGGPDEDDD